MVELGWSGNIYDVLMNKNALVGDSSLTESLLANKLRGLKHKLQEYVELGEDQTTAIAIHI